MNEERTTAILCTGCGRPIRSVMWRGELMWADDDGLWTCPEVGLDARHEPPEEATP